jgi:hypothetical protein
LLAGRAVDRRTGIGRVALNLLAAARAEEFEFRHNELVLTDYVTREPSVY